MDDTAGVPLPSEPVRYVTMGSSVTADPLVTVLCVGNDIPSHLTAAGERTVAEMLVAALEEPPCRA
jgi:hypothetical protein